MLFSCSKQWLWFLIHTDVFPDVSAFSICHLCHLPAKMMVFPGFNDIALRSLTLTHRRKGKSARSGAPDVKAQLCASPGLGKRFWRAATGTGVVRDGGFPGIGGPACAGRCKQPRRGREKADGRIMACKSDGKSIWYRRSLYIPASLLRPLADSVGSRRVQPYFYRQRRIGCKQYERLSNQRARI